MTCDLTLRDVRSVARIVNLAHRFNCRTTHIAVEAESTAEEAPATEDTVETVETVADDSAGGLRNRRPTGKVSHRRRRSRRGVAVDE